MAAYCRDGQAAAGYRTAPAGLRRPGKSLDDGFLLVRYECATAAQRTFLEAMDI